MLSVSFVMEQHLGHQTYYQNLRRFVDSADNIDPNWVSITYELEGGVLGLSRLLSRNIQGTLCGAREVRAGLRKKNADVVFFNTQVPAALGGPRVGQRPYVIATDITPVQYDAIGHLYNHKPDKIGLLRNYKHRVNRRLFQNAAKVLPWSTWVGESLMDAYDVDRSRVSVLPPGVDLDVWHPPSLRPDRALKILFVGGDFERKGGPLLLQAFRELGEETAELHLVTRSELQIEPGVTVYNDMQPNSPELISLYQHCNVFVLPSSAEAFGIAAIEATASGLPVIATSFGGLTDIVSVGETGWLIEPGDGPALVSKLRVLAQDTELRCQMANAARARAEKNFDARQNASRLLSILAEVADPQQGSV